MNFFSQWLLSPRFQFEVCPIEKFKNKIYAPQALCIQIISEDELPLLPAADFSRTLNGELKAQTFYPTDTFHKNYLIALPKQIPKKLNFESPGQAHKTSHLGSIFSQCFSTFSNNHSLFENCAEFTLSVSAELKKIIAGEEAEFLVGVLQRSVSNKLQKNERAKKNLKTFFISEDAFSMDVLKRALTLSHSMCITRSLINMPPNTLNPETYESILRHVVANEKTSISSRCALDIEVLEHDTLKAEGCELICAVGEGSPTSPRIIKLTYAPSLQTPEIPFITLVGKGITFDSGGYDIKPSGPMRNMKKDMGGSAAAVGVFFACAALELPVKLSCYLAVAENMVSGTAMRPGDIYKSHAGLSVEIDNTDAEGRLVLADALSLACAEKPHWLIDLATLTGAARVALGPLVDGLFGNDPSTTELLYKSGIETGDWVWPMPLPVDYESYLDSNIADMANSSSSGFAGAITAGLFLQKFVSVEKWSHIDTFMWCDKPHLLWQEGGAASGKCVRLVTRAIEEFVKKY